jgi:hypothetical protein
MTFLRSEIALRTSTSDADDSQSHSRSLSRLPSGRVGAKPNLDLWVPERVLVFGDQLNPW